jgi:hypothetical protein
LPATISTCSSVGVPSGRMMVLDPEGIAELRIALPSSRGAAADSARSRSRRGENARRERRIVRRSRRPGSAPRLDHEQAVTGDADRPNNASPATTR